MPPLMVFDNDCVLCSRLVRFILKYEQNDMLHFVAAWSDEGKSLAENYSFTQADLNQSFLLIENEYAYTHSDAGLKLLSYLKHLGLIFLFSGSFREFCAMPFTP